MKELRRKEVELESETFESYRSTHSRTIRTKITAKKASQLLISTPPLFKPGVDTDLSAFAKYLNAQNLYTIWAIFAQNIVKLVN